MAAIVLGLQRGASALGAQDPSPTLTLSCPSPTPGSLSAGAVDGGNGLEVAVDSSSGAYNVTVDGVPWLLSGAGTPATYFGRTPALRSATPTRDGGLAFGWGLEAEQQLRWETAVLPGPVPGSLVFRQSWPAGIANTSVLWRDAQPRPSKCGSAVARTDQTGGRMCCGTPGRRGSAPAGFRNYTRAECCAACLAAASCNAFVMAEAETPSDPTCWLISGATSSRSRPDRDLTMIPGRGGGTGAAGAGDQDSVLSGWPVFENGASRKPLNLLGWGGCQLSPGHGQDATGTHIGRWTGQHPTADHEGLTPFLLYDDQARAVVVSPSTNFFVGIHSNKQDPALLAAGIKASVTSIPPKFEHDTLIVAGHGLNDTLVAFGDILLAKSGKPRVDPYKDDFVLSHLGHWVRTAAQPFRKHFILFQEAAPQTRNCRPPHPTWVSEHSRCRHSNTAAAVRTMLGHITTTTPRLSATTRRHCSPSRRTRRRGRSPSSTASGTTGEPQHHCCCRHCVPVITSAVLVRAGGRISTAATLATTEA